MEGVSSNIMVGQAVSSGTGCVDVLFDEEMYIDHLTTIDEDEDTLDMELPPKKKSEYCSSENFDFSKNIILNNLNDIIFFIKNIKIKIPLHLYFKTIKIFRYHL